MAAWCRQYDGGYVYRRFGIGICLGLARGGLVRRQHSNVNTPLYIDEVDGQFIHERCTLGSSA